MNLADVPQHWIDGQPMRPETGDTMPLIDPATGEQIGTVELADASTADAAVTAARRAFEAWSRTPPVERSNLMHAWASRVDALAETWAQVETRQVGTPIRLTQAIGVPGTVDCLRYFAGAARLPDGQPAGDYSGAHLSLECREPIGVIGSIVPWNYPLQTAAWKASPAVAAGNTVVLKPSELTPLTAVLLAQAASDVGLPPGVVNVVTGTGPVVGDALVRHPGVNMISFTGSTTVGRQIMRTAADTTTRVHLELGGKAPFVVLDDADLEAATHGAVAGALVNNGQDCTAATRAYVHRSLYEGFVAGVADVFGQVRLGPPLDPATDQGPLVSHAHRERVASFVEHARSYARVICGGRFPGGALSGGYYYEPTLMTGAPQDSEIVQTEVFGPVLAVLPVDDDEQALRLANDSPYGLAASVWTADVHRSLRFARELRAGCVWVNDHASLVSEMPHGGYGQSGFGKDLSVHAMLEHTQLKHVMLDATGVVRKDWHTAVFTPA